MQMHDASLTTPAPSTPPQNTNWLDNLLTAAGGILQLVNQQKLAKTNLERAKAGQPPIELSQLPGAVPTAQIQVGVTGDTSKFLTWAGLGVGTVVLVNMLKKKRR